MSQCNDKGPKIIGAVYLSDKEFRELRIRQRLYDVIIGVDPGVDTGFAVWKKREKKLELVTTLKIHRALTYIDSEITRIGKGEILVLVEDARLRTWIPKDRGREYLQGVGSVKRDAGIWEDYLEDRGIDYQLLAPAAGRTKWSSDYFKKLTGYKGRTSNHGRDAAALVYGL